MSHLNAQKFSIVYLTPSYSLIETSNKHLCFACESRSVHAKLLSYGICFNVIDLFDREQNISRLAQFHGQIYKHYNSCMIEMTLVWPHRSHKDTQSQSTVKSRAPLWTSDKKTINLTMYVMIIICFTIWTSVTAGHNSQGVVAFSS
jgi:hypothetical protein